MAYAQAHLLPLPSEPSSSRGQSLAFTVDQTKLSPAFEAYRLIQDDPSKSNFGSTSFALPGRPPSLIDLYQSSSGQGENKLVFTGLGYKETKERALHQVLVPAAGDSDGDKPFAAYVDANGFIVVLTYDADRKRVVGHPVYRLQQQAFLPSLASISSTTWLASDGQSLMQIKLQKTQPAANGIVRWISEALVEWRVKSGEIGAIKACNQMSQRIRVLLQSSKTKLVKGKGKETEAMQGLGFQRDGQGQKSARNGSSGHSHTHFELQLVDVDNADSGLESEGPRTARVLWTLEGDEPLITSKLDEQESQLFAEAPFSSIEEDHNRMEGIAQEETPLNDLTPTASTRGRRRAPHFSWAQTGDTVTIAFALPSWIIKSHIRAHFSLNALSLSFTQEALTLLDAPSSSGKITEINPEEARTQADDVDDFTHAARMIASGRYVSRLLWAEIDPSGSVWTVERARGCTLLTLHLEKRHEGTRWMQIFADRIGRKRKHADAEEKSSTQLSFQQARSAFELTATGQADQSKEAELEDAEDNEDEVPETMDPSELLTMLEGMQKYTVDEESAEYGLDRTGFHPSSGSGQNGGTSLSLDRPSLLKDNLEEEDANVGRNLVVSSVTQPPSTNIDISSSKGGVITILATSLPSDRPESSAVVIKHDLDGAIFTSNHGSWKHVATMPALAFVLASKRDARRVHIHKRKEGGWVVLAFESAPQVTGSGNSTAAGSGAGNLFLYYSPASATDKHASSRVVRLGTSTIKDGEEDAGGASGALLGVCSVSLPCPEGELEEALVCLCENRILMLRGVL